MPFLKGSMPIRRTIYFLDKGELFFRTRFKVLVAGFNYNQKGHDGMKDFVFWEFAQIQWKNPNLQLLKVQKMSPIPFVMALTSTGSEIVLDCDHLDRKEIHDVVKKFLCKSDEYMEKLQAPNQPPRVMFGEKSARQCICEVEGQRPCTSVVRTPLYLSGTWRWNKNERNRE